MVRVRHPTIISRYEHRNTRTGTATDKVRKHTVGTIAELVVPNPNGGQVNCFATRRKSAQAGTRRLFERELIPFLNQRDYHAKLRGASRNGDRNCNQQLALQGILRVKQYLLEIGLTGQPPYPKTRSRAKKTPSSAPNDFGLKARCIRLISIPPLLKKNGKRSSAPRTASMRVSYYATT